MELNPLFPITTETGVEGIITVGGIALGGLAAQFGTPLYVYDAKSISIAFARLKKPFNKYYPGDFQITYASKAYLSLKYAAKICALGCSIDVVSLSELKFALEAGFSPAKIHLHGNNKSEDEIRLAVNQGIDAIVVDSLDELNFVEKICKELNNKARIWLRLNPDVQVDTHKAIQTGHKASKFGISIGGGQAGLAVHQALSSRFVTLKGVHTHLGSQIFNPEPYKNAIQQMLVFCKTVNWHPDVISPGGGWGVPYTKDFAEVDPEEWIKTIATTVDEWCKKENQKTPILVLEPGRWLVARAGLAIYRIGAVKETADGEIIAALDGGMADNPRPALYGTRYTAEILGDTRGRPLKNVRLVGRYCESGDELIRCISLPFPQRGDLIVVPVSGAYQLSMASNYNLADRPAVLWLENGGVEILQKREIACESTWWRGD